VLLAHAAQLVIRLNPLVSTCHNLHKVKNTCDAMITMTYENFVTDKKQHSVAFVSMIEWQLIIIQCKQGTAQQTGKVSALS
jgi:hypothetical protein